MNPPDQQKEIKDDELVLAEILLLRKDLAALQCEMKADFVEVQDAFDRVEHHLRDISERLNVANQTLARRLCA